MLDHRIIKIVWNDDGTRSVSITEKLGYYSYIEEGEGCEIHEVDGQWVDVIYWGPISGGGLYETAEEALRGAKTKYRGSKMRLYRTTLLEVCCDRTANEAYEACTTHAEIVVGYCF